MPLWAPAAIIAGLLLVSISARLTERWSALRHRRPPTPNSERYAPLVLRGTIILAGGYLIALGFAGL